MIEIVPPGRLGPVRIGTTVRQAEADLRADGAREVGREDGLPPGAARYASGLTVQLHPGEGESVEAAELWRAPGKVPVVYRALDLFADPADVVVRVLRGVTEIRVEDGGCAVLLPRLRLALWRPYVSDVPADDEGYRFQSVLMATPERLRRVAAGHG